MRNLRKLLLSVVLVLCLLSIVGLLMESNIRRECGSTACIMVHVIIANGMAIHRFMIAKSTTDLEESFAITTEQLSAEHALPMQTI